MCQSLYCGGLVQMKRLEKMDHPEVALKERGFSFRRRCVELCQFLESVQDGGEGDTMAGSRMGRLWGLEGAME